MAKKKVATKPTDAKALRQKRLIERLKKKEHWMKWAIIAALIIILLLLLFIGYVTDWTAGLKKDTDLTSLSANLDSAKKDGDKSSSGKSSGGKEGSGGGSGGSSSSGTTSTGGTGSGGGSTTSSDTSKSSRSSTSHSSTTTNNTTNNNTTNNNGGGDTPSNPGGDSGPTSDDLLNLYAGLNVGGSLDDAINRAKLLGIDVKCRNVLLVRNCTFSVGALNISVKGLLNTGLLTSILKNF